jgi:DNA-binding GntR family transcriptional regulator
VPPPRRENSAVDTLVEALRHDIMTGTLKPGQRIDLDEWADRMEASRTPVRLALERLETEGFVKLSGRRGATIIDVTVSHIEDVLATRLVLDSALGRAGARNLTAHDLDTLRSFLERIEALTLPEEHAQMVEPALGFHAYLYQAAGAAMMFRLEMQSVHHTNVFLSSMWFTNRRIAYVGREHFRQLFKACEAKDPDRVERLIRDYRIDMAGVILQDRVRTDVLHILPGVLSQAEFRRLQEIVDDGADPGTPTHPATAKPTSTSMGGRATKSASNRDLRYKARGAARSS